MTLDQAIQKARELEWAASEDWPMGVPDDLADQLRACDDTIDRHLASLSVDQRAEASRQIIRRLTSREYAATVAPRRKKAS